jgi:hypothetical protein
MKRVEAFEVQVTAIENIDGTRLGNQNIEDM